MTIIQTFEEFCAQNGYSRPLDDHSTFKMPHGFTKADRRRPLRKLIDGLQENKQARDAYDALVQSGAVRPPTPQEALEIKATGHDDNPSVQAARRVLAKRATREAAG